MVSRFEELLVKKGLYDDIDISLDDLESMERLFSGAYFNKFNINCFCTQCKEMRTFESIDTQIYEEKGFKTIYLEESGTKKRKPTKEKMFANYLNKRYSLSFRCTRNHSHSILFDLLVTDCKIIKIGQYPSFADISIGDIAKYKNVLDDKFIEYGKSLGLFSHGIGIGSFVYLRRIIEKLVFEKYREIKDSLQINEKDFIDKHFDEKLDILKKHLPKALIKNKNVYGIVSKGIHELSEEECLNMYPYIKVGIELILDDILAENERKGKEDIFSKFVANTTGELRNR